MERERNLFTLIAATLGTLLLAAHPQGGTISPTSTWEGIKDRASVVVARLMEEAAKTEANEILDVDWSSLYAGVRGLVSAAN